MLTQHQIHINFKQRDLGPGTYQALPSEHTLTQCRFIAGPSSIVDRPIFIK